MIKFTIPGTPVAKARARSGRTKTGSTVHYTPKNTAYYENLAKMCAYDAMNKYDKLTGPVQVVITCYLPIPKSFSKKKREMAVNNKIFPIIKPDVDNLAKSICDAMNGIVYDDDKQIVRAQITKLYGIAPMAEVTVECI